MCLSKNLSPDSPFVVRFNPMNLKIPVYRPEVAGFDAGAAPTQADADSVAAAIESLHEGLPPAQQAVLEQLLLQAEQTIA